jgi:adenylate kinase
MTYNAQSEPPRASGICDNCGSRLVVREDDRPERVRTRLAVYAERTRPLADYYRSCGLLRVVDATGTEEDVFTRCRRAVEMAGTPGEADKSLV